MKGKAQREDHIVHEEFDKKLAKTPTNVRLLRLKLLLFSSTKLKVNSFVF